MTTNSLKKILYCLVIFTMHSTFLLNEVKANDLKPISTKSALPPAKTVIKFLNWYWDNETAINDITLINMPNDSTIPFSVNTAGTKKYLSVLKNSGFFSDKYIQDWKKYFEDYEKSYKKELQYEGCPEGFDHNFIMNSNDPEERPTDMNAIKIDSEKIKGNKAYVTIAFPHGSKLNYTLTKHNNNWLIDEIMGTDTE